MIEKKLRNTYIGFTCTFLLTFKRKLNYIKVTINDKKKLTYSNMESSDSLHSPLDL